MKRLIGIFILFVASLGFGQTTAVTATITAPDGAIFANGTGYATFTPPSGNINCNQYTINGSTFPCKVNFTMDGSGTFNVTLTDDHKISPQGGRWTFTLCSLATIACTNSLQDVFGSSINLTTALSAAVVNFSNDTIRVPRFYMNGEVKVGGSAGGDFYYNLTSKSLTYYDGTQWHITCDSINVTSGCGTGGSVINLQTNGVANTSQTVLNLKNGTGIGITSDGVGGVTINNTATLTAITGTLTQNFIPIATSTGTNGTIGNSTATETVVNTVQKNWTIPRLSYHRKTEAFNWIQTPGGTLTGGTPATVTLTPIPFGVESSFIITNQPMWLYISGGTGTAEPVRITSSSGCNQASAGTSSCTVTFTPFNSHSGSWTIGSATTGLQEALNDGEISQSAGRYAVADMPCYENLPANIVHLQAPVVTHGNRLAITGSGCALVEQDFNWGPAFIVGDLHSGGTYFFNALDQFTAFPNATVQPQINLISSMSRTGCPSACVFTVAFTSAHDFTQQDVNLGTMYLMGGYLNDNGYAGWGTITSIVNSTTITVTPNLNPGTNITTTYAGGWLVKMYSFGVDNLLQHGILNHVNFASTGGARWMQGWIPLVDQSNYIFGLDNQGSGNIFLNPTDSYFSYFIYAPGPNNPNGAVGFYYGLNCSMQGSGGCIYWDAGDDLFVTDSVIQGYCDVGIKMSRRRGGFGALTVKGTHFESNGCGAGLGFASTASIVSNGADVEIDDATGSGPTVRSPSFGTFGNGLQTRFYYVQAVANTSDPICTTQPPDVNAVGVRCQTSFGTGPLMYAGSAAIDSVTGATNVPVKWYTAPVATHYKVVAVNAVTATAQQFVPNGTGAFLVQDNINPLTSCTDSLCTITDSTGTTLGSTTITPYVMGSYAPYFPYWPASVFMSVIQDSGTGNNIPQVGRFRGPLGNGYVVSEELTGMDTTVLTSSVQGGLGGSTTSATPFLFKSVGAEIPSNSTPLPGTAWLFPSKLGLPGQNDMSTTAGIKPKLNLTPYVSNITYPNEEIGLYDCAFLTKTIFTSNRRPSSDNCDATLGMMSNNDAYVRAMNSWNAFINHVPTGPSDTSWIFQVNSAGVIVHGTISSAGLMGGVQNPSGTTVYHVDGINITSICTLMSGLTNANVKVYEDILETNITCDPFNAGTGNNLIWHLGRQSALYTMNVPITIKATGSWIEGDSTGRVNSTTYRGAAIAPSASYTNPYVSTLPSGFTITASTTGCTSKPAAGTYFVEVTWSSDSTRESPPSNETSVTLDGTTNCPRIVPGAHPANVTQYQVYACTNPGGGCVSGSETWKAGSAIGSSITLTAPLSANNGNPPKYDSTGAFIVAGGPAAASASNFIFNAGIRNISIDCVDTTGCEAFANLNAEERSGAQNVDAYNIPGACGFLWEGYSSGLGASNSFLKEIAVGTGSISNPTVGGICIDQVESMRGLDSATITPTGTPACIVVNGSNIPPNSGTPIANAHMEKCTTGIAASNYNGTIRDHSCSPNVTTCVTLDANSTFANVTSIRHGGSGIPLTDATTGYSETRGFTGNYTNSLVAQVFQFVGKTPTASCTGCGATATVTFDTKANNSAGTMQINTSGGGETATIQLTLTFAGTTFGVDDTSCSFEPKQGPSNWLDNTTHRVLSTGTGSQQVKFINGGGTGTALTDSTSYNVKYQCSPY